MTLDTKICVKKLTFAALALGAIVFLGVRLARADKMNPKVEPPAEATRLWESMAGTWSSKELAFQMGSQAGKGSGKVTCEKAAGGWALRCRGRFLIAGTPMEEEDILGWDRDSGKFHLYCANSSGEVHDHAGTLDGDTLNLEHASTKDGKPFIERLAFTVRSGKELTWKNTATLGGQTVFLGEATFRK